MPRRVIIISLIVITLSLVAFWLMPNNLDSVYQRYQQTATNNISVAPPQEGDVKIYTFAEFFTTLTPTQQNCFKNKISTTRIGELLNGAQMISDSELEELNNCSQ